MTWRRWWLLVPFALMGCSAPVETLSVLPDEYEIHSTPRGGMYGSWLALAPSNALAKEALARCPHGYRTTNIEQGNGFFWTDFVRWDILCEPRPAS